MKTSPHEERIGEYPLLRPVGSGGHSKVYEAWDQRRNRSVAIKVLTGLSDSPEEALRLVEAEVATMGQFDANPHIVTVHDHDLHHGAPYIVMTYYAAGSVRDKILTSGPSHPDDVLDCARDMARALVQLHEKQVVHRDLKPANIFMSEFGYVLGDFGISLHSHDPHTVRSGQLTPAFAPPEAIEGREPSPAADVYSLGATLYFMLTGRRPFDVPDAGLMHAILYTSPASIDRDDVPEPLVGLVMKMLSKHPSERPTAAKLLERVLTIQGAPVRVGRPAVAPASVIPERDSDRTVVRSKRSLRPWLVGLGAVAAVASAGVAAGLLNSSDDAELAQVDIAGPSQAAPVGVAPPIEGLSVTATDSEISVDWTAVPDASGYKVIQVATDGAETIGNVPAPPATFAVTALPRAADTHGWCIVVQPAVDGRRVPSISELPVRCSDGSAFASLADLRSAS